MAEQTERSKNLGAIFDRIAKVERDFTAMSTALSSVATSLERLEHNQQELGRTVANRGRTDWAVVGTIGGGIAAILVFYTGLVTSPIATDQDRVRTEYRREISLVANAYDLRLEAITADIGRLEQEMAERTVDRYTKTDHYNFARDINERIRDLENGRRP